MAKEQTVRREREEEPTRFAAWRESRRGSAFPARAVGREDEELDENEREEAMLTTGIRLSRADRDLVEEEAAAEGIKPSQYLRVLIREVLADSPEREWARFLKALADAKRGLEDYIEENEGMKPSGFLEEKNTVEHAKEALEALSKFCERLGKKPGEKKAPADNPKKSTW